MTGAQHSWSRLGKKSLTKFDWNCASTREFEAAGLKRIVPRALKHAPEETKFPDRAFAFDLNGDLYPEYFVPFLCGATGNCTWAVFTLRPQQFLGFINGKHVYVRAQENGWPDIFTYGHLSAAEGVIETYHFRLQYQRQNNVFPIGDENQSLEIQQVRGHKLPGVFNRATTACENIEQ